MKQGNGLVQVGSRYSVDETMWRLEAAFRGEGAAGVCLGGSQR